MVESARITDREAYEDYMIAHGIDAEIDITLLRSAEDGRWRAGCNGTLFWGDTASEALVAVAEHLRDE